MTRNEIRIDPDDSIKIRDQWRLIHFLLGFARKYWHLFSLSIIGMVIGSAIAAYLPIIIRTFLDQDIAHQVTLIEAYRTALIYLLLLITRMIIVYIKDYLFAMASEYAVNDMRTTLFEKLMTMDLNFFNAVPNGEIVSRITNDTETIKEFWKVFLGFAEGTINAMAVGVAMWQLSRPIFWVFLSFLPLVIFLIYAYQKLSTIVYRQMRHALGAVNSWLSESTMGMWIIQQFAQTKRMIQHFDAINDRYVTARIRMFRMNALLLMPAVNLIEQIVLVFVIWLFGSQLLSGHSIEIGMLYAFVAYSKSFFHPIGNILNTLSNYQDGLVAASRGLNLLDSHSLNPRQNVNPALTSINGSVQLKDVKFSYDNQHLVLNGVNMQIDHGQMMAIIGHTGSGKSTIINLLMRLYEYQSGEIYIDNHSIRNYDINLLRENIVLVQQDPFLFYGTIKDNIKMHGHYSDQEVEEAASFTGANHFIEQLPQGYDTIISEGGQSLSAGQKQLINIARAVIRQPKILILDEATANIDTESELYIQRSLDRIRQQATLIVIAHRLSTIREANTIYLMQKGRVVESGTHTSLLAQKGLYYEMYEVQTQQQDE